jgi:hypothetical protein
MKKILPLLFCLVLTLKAYASAPFAIVIHRESVKNGLITGTISVNGTKIGHAFENADLKIPTGDYPGTMRYFSSNGFVQGPSGSMGNKGDFLLEVANVPGRTNILLHGGNKPQHSKGCILLGAVTHDGSAKVAPEPLQKLRRMFYGSDNPNATPDKAITITITSALPN